MTRSLALAFALALVAGCPTPSNPDTGGTRDTPAIDTPMADTPGEMLDTPMALDTPGGPRVCSVGATGCDVITQDCPMMGSTAQGCYLTNMSGTLSTICAPSGTVSEGGTCTNANDCAEGMTCQDGHCRDLCCMEATSDCMVGYHCTPYSDGAGGILPVGVCEPPADCTVIPNAGCPDGSACIPSMDGTLNCFSAGTLTEGMPCGGAAGACLPGLGCFGADPDFTCIAFCRLADSPTTCTGGRTCQMQAIVGGGYGLCL